MAENKNFLQRVFGRKDEEVRYSGTILPHLGMTGLPAVLSKSGLKEGQDALQLSAVYAAVSKIADTIASLESTVISTEADGTPSVLNAHPVAVAIGREPNPHMGAYEFWQMVVSDACLYGVGHALIMDNGEIYHIPANRVSWSTDKKGRKWYSYTGAPNPVPQDKWLEIKAFRALNPTQVQHQNLSTQKAIQDFGSKFFESGGMLGGILSTKEPMSAEQMTQAADQWAKQYAGSQNAHKVALLGGGFTYQPLSVPLSQLQWTESRTYGAEEVARIYGVPPAMLGMDSNTAYSNYEQQVLQFHQGCVLPWVRRIELEIERKLLKDPKLSVRFNVDTLLRGDLSTRANYFSTALQHGWMTTNQVRAKEGMGPVEGGDVITKQVNQIPLHYMEAYAESIIGQSEGDSTDPDDSGNEPTT